MYKIPDEALKIPVKQSGIVSSKCFTHLIKTFITHWFYYDIMDKLYADSETGCCKKFDPRPWDEKQIKWEGKLFLKDHVITFFRIPVNMGKVMARDAEKIADAKALVKTPVMLYDCNSLFGADIYIAVSKNVPGAQMEKISGTFLSKVFEGPYKDTGKWVKSMQEYAKSKKKEIRKMYFFYTTCPRCAKYYGKNYTVVLAKI
jgi:hypothetical protein